MDQQEYKPVFLDQPGVLEPLAPSNEVPIESNLALPASKRMVYVFILPNLLHVVCIAGFFWYEITGYKGGGQSPVNGSGIAELLGFVFSIIFFGAAILVGFGLSAYATSLPFRSRLDAFCGGIVRVSAGYIIFFSIVFFAKLFGKL